jgi:hypothetical protein
MLFTVKTYIRKIFYKKSFSKCVARLQFCNWFYEAVSSGEVDPWLIIVQLHGFA